MPCTTPFRVALGALLTVLTLGALAACGDRPQPDASRPELPFPPRAFEPPSTARRDGHDEPAGRVVRIGGAPEGIAVDPRTGAVGVAVGGPRHTFAILAPDTLAVRRTLALGADARHVQAGDAGFLVPLEPIDRLAIVPGGGAAVRTVQVGDEPHDAAQVGADIVVTDEFGEAVSVVRGGRRRATVAVDVQPGGVAAVSTHQAAVVSVRANTIAVLDLRTLAVGPSQNAGYGPSHVVALPDGRAFVADTRGDAVLEYATRPRLKALRRLGGVGAPYGLAVDARRGRLWVTDVRGGRLLLVDVRRAGAPRVIRRWTAVDQPNSVAVAPSTGAAYVAGARGGLVQRIATDGAGD